MADINDFINQYMPAAVKAASQLGTDPAHVLGQWGLETGWGRSVIPGTNNLGNIKALPGQSGTAAQDNQLGTTDHYANYSSPEASAQAYADLLSRSRYQGAVQSGGNTNQFVGALVNGGYAQDKQYASKLASAISTVRATGSVPTLEDMKNTLAQEVASDYAKGVAPAAIVSGLLNSNLAGADVKAALALGKTAEQIVNVVGGEVLAHFKATDPGEKVKAQSFFTNVGQGASNAVSDLANGARQLGNRVVGDAAGLKSLQTEQAAKEADPARQALEQTGGGKVGSFGVKALPYLAAGVVAPEGLIPALVLDGAVGAASGALTPTTKDGQFAHNILAEAALGAVGGGGGYGVGKGATNVASRVLGGDAAATARLAEAQAQGLPANVASVNGANGFWRNVADSMPENGSVISAQARADQAVATKVAEGLGLKNYAGAIDTNMLNSARPAIKQALDDATNVTVTLPKSLKADLQGLVKTGTNPLTEGIANNSTVNAAINNLNKAIDSGTPVAGTDLQGLASELKGLLYSSGASHSEKQLASNVIDKINGSLTSNMTAQQAQAFKIANEHYRNLLAVQKMVKASNDTGVVTPRQMLQAAKTGSFSNSFLKGDAPFQDLAGMASELYGPSARKGLGAVIGKATGGHGLDMAALIMNPSLATLAGVGIKSLASNLLAKAATSESPAMIRLLTGAGGKPLNPVLASAIARALSAGAAASPATFFR